MDAASDGTEPQHKRARRDASNPLVYFDVAIGGEPAGKVIFELFTDVVPKVCSLLFRQAGRDLLCTALACIKSGGARLHCQARFASLSPLNMRWKTQAYAQEI